MKKRNRNNWIIIPEALLLAVCTVVGLTLEKRGYLDLSRGWMWISILFAALIYGVVTAVIYRGLDRLLQRASENANPAEAPGEKTESVVGEREASKKAGLLGKADGLIRRHPYRAAAVCMLFFWTVVLLGVFPGFFVYDAQDELNEVMTRVFTMHHPLLHVLSLGGVILAVNKVFGSFNAGICVYMILQMLLLCAVFLLVLRWLLKRRAPRWLTLGTVLFYALFPVVQMYVLCSAKDGIYSAGLMLFILCLLEVFEDPGAFLSDKRNMLCLVASVFVTANFRNNGFYVAVVMVPFTVIALMVRLHGSRKEGTGMQESKARPVVMLLCLLVLGLILSKGTNTGLKLALRASDHEHQEILTVPLQQLARAWEKEPEIFSEEERKTLFSYLPEDVIHTYRPKLSDPVKAGFNNAYYEEDSSSFYRLWLSIGKKSPGTYLNGWLMTCYGMFTPGAVIDTYKGNQVFTFVYGDSSYFGYETEQPGERHSLLPFVDRFFRYMSLNERFQKLPVVSLLFSPGFWFFIWLLGEGYFIYRKRYLTAIAFLPAFLNWGTVLFGPGVVVRYGLIWCFALPLLLCQIRRCDILS